MKKGIHLLFVLIFALVVQVEVEAQYAWSKRIVGKGELVKKTFEVDDYTQFGLGVAGKVIVKKGSSNSITIEAQKNIIDNIEVKQKGKSLGLESKKNFRTNKSVTIYLEMDEIEGLSIGGSGEIIVEDRFMNLDELSLAIGGSGSIIFGGSARSVDVSVAGSGDVKCEDLMTKSAAISIAGSGNVYIGVDGNLDVSIAGSGDVYYIGSARVSSSVAGSGSVSSL